MAYERTAKVSKEVLDLARLEEKDEFMEMARQIAGLIKEIGSLPTPRQMKMRLDIDARKMRKVCGAIRTDPYNMLVKEARKILLEEEKLVVGFGRMEERKSR
ncbi:hypothetical protein IJI64_02395 [Candidatus Saccharibacteria bacterium]|nr:hypothetical protein [Candidatus Saccharibacteria bacterium]